MSDSNNDAWIICWKLIFIMLWDEVKSGVKIKTLMVWKIAINKGPEGQKKRKNTSMLLHILISI